MKPKQEETFEVRLDPSWSESTIIGSKKFRVSVFTNEPTYFTLKLECICDSTADGYWICDGRVILQITSIKKKSELNESFMFASAKDTLFFKMFKLSALDTNQSSEDQITFVIKVKSEVVLNNQDCRKILEDIAKRRKPILKRFTAKLIERNRIEELATWVQHYKSHKNPITEETVQHYQKIFVEEKEHLINWHYVSSENQSLTVNDTLKMATFFENRHFSNCPDLEFLCEYFQEHGFDLTIITQDKARIKRIVEFLERTQLRRDQTLQDTRFQKEIDSLRVVDAFAKGDTKLGIFIAKTKLIEEGDNLLQGALLRAAKRFGGCATTMVRHCLQTIDWDFSIKNYDELCLNHSTCSIRIFAEQNKELFQFIFQELSNKLLSKLSGKKEVFCDEFKKQQSNIESQNNLIELIQYLIVKEEYREIPENLQQLTENMDGKETWEVLFKISGNDAQSFAIIVNALLDLDDNNVELDEDYELMKTSITNGDLEKVKTLTNSIDQRMNLLKMAKTKHDSKIFTAIIDVTFTVNYLHGESDVTFTQCSNPANNFSYSLSEPKNDVDQGVVEYLKDQLLHEENKDMKIFIGKLLERNQGREMKTWMKLYQDYENPMQEAAEHYPELSFIIDEYFQVIREEHYYLRTWIFMQKSETEEEAFLSFRDRYQLGIFFENRNFRNKFLKELTTESRKWLDIQHDNAKINRIVNHLFESLPEVDPIVNKRNDGLYEKIGDKLPWSFIGKEALDAALAIAQEDFEEAEDSIQQYSEKYMNIYNGKYGSPPLDLNLRNDPKCKESLSHLLAKHSGTDELLDFVTTGQTIEKLNEMKEHPLNIASEYGNLDVIKYLVQSDIDNIKVQLDDGDALIVSPASKRSLDCSYDFAIKPIILSNSSSSRFKCVADELIIHKLFQAVVDGNITEVKNLLKVSRDKFPVNKKGENLMQVAAQTQDFNMMKIILDMNLSNKHKRNHQDDKNEEEVETKKAKREGAEDNYVIDDDGLVVLNQANDENSVRTKDLE